MSEQKFEPCTLRDATHVSINGIVYKIGSYDVRAFWNSNRSEQVGINIVVTQHDQRTIRQDLFLILGIQPLKEINPEPIEFETVFAKYDDKWYPLYGLNDVASFENRKKARFRCVEILEDEE